MKVEALPNSYDIIIDDRNIATVFRNEDDSIIMNVDELSLVELEQLIKSTKLVKEHGFVNFNVKGNDD